MLFNSLDFAVFLPAVFLVYWFITSRNIKLQNAFIVLASYMFYGWWDWRFLSLIFASTVIDYFVGLSLERSTINLRRKLLLALSITANLGILFFFKYFDFFVESFTSSFSFMGMTIQRGSLNIILPVGISFYTFQTLSYSIDIYRRKLAATDDFIAFAAFVSFFPQLVAGPIERATHLLPQFFKKKTFEYDHAFNGFKQIVWGFFKKVVVADNCALFVNQVFENHTEYSGSSLLLASVFFAIQIYCDFSGYSDIAIGTARLFGFNLKQNFAYPYFSRDIAEFWRRWHISLSTWFRDYLYIPLGGSNVSKVLQIRNVFVVFLVSGLWHGANWTFVLWGLVHALFFIPLLLARRHKKNRKELKAGVALPGLQELAEMLSTFLIVTLAFILFRAKNVSVAVDFYSEIFSSSIFSTPYIFGVGKEKLFVVLCFICVLFGIEWLSRDRQHGLDFQKGFSLFTEWALCFGIVMIIFLFGEWNQSFIYFQF